jgi:hypothetical protein
MYATIEIMGGLGNQLFQIFTLLAYSFRHKTAYYFSDEPIKCGQRKKTYWSTPLLGANPLGVSTPTPPIVGGNSPLIQSALSQNGGPGVYPRGGVGACPHNERSFHYQEIPAPGPNENVRLFGYFQSYKYFQDYQAEIYQLINLRETQHMIKAKYPAITNYEKTLAVHFRVGDYVTLPDCHPLMTLAYYVQALSQFLHDTADQEARQSAKCETLHAAKTAAETSESSTWNLLYFCEKNDQAYVQTRFIQPLQANPLFKDKFIFQCIDHALEDWEQLIVMSLCQHHIIANSTFSWWGAFLGWGQAPRPPLGADAFGTRHDGGVGVLTPKGAAPQVYYPTTWFGPAMGYKNMADLFPHHWNKINV